MDTELEKKGLSLDKRREVIVITLNSNLPSVFPASYRLKWGGAKSQTRYEMILGHLSWLAGQRRADRLYKVAVSHWDADLTWFRAKR